MQVLCNVRGFHQVALLQDWLLVDTSYNSSLVLATYISQSDDWFTPSSEVEYDNNNYFSTPISPSPALTD